MANHSLPALSAILHPEKLSDGSPMWVALCPDLGVASQGVTQDEAREMLLEAVSGFLEFASETEVQDRLADGYTATVEELRVAA